MKTNIILLTLLTINYLSVIGQSTFQRIYGNSNCDIAYSLELIDNNYFLIGTSNSFSSNKDVFLLKTNENGDLLWSKTFDGTKDDVAYDIKKIDDNNLVFTGYIKSNEDSANILLVKINSAGNIIWTKSYGGDSIDVAYSIFPTYDKGFVMTGISNSFYNGKEDVIIIKTDSIGDLIWSKIYGSSERDFGQSIIQTIDSSFVITGYTNGFGYSGWVIYLIKLDKNGSLIWSKTIDFDNHTSNKQRFAYSIIESLNKKYYFITGSNGKGSIGDAQPFLMKLDSSGNHLWTKTYTLNSGDCGVTSIEEVNDGFIMGGYMGNYYPALLKVDTAGEPQWTYHYIDYNSSDDNGIGYQVKQTNYESYLLVGYSESFGDTSIHFIKTDKFGISGCNEDIPTGEGNSSDRTVYMNNAASIFDSTETIIDSISLNIIDQTFNTNMNTLCFTIGTKEIKVKKNKINIYPIPAKYKIIVNVTNENIINIDLTNLLGSFIKKYKNINSSTVELDLSDLSKGAYFITVYTIKNTYIRKIMINR